MKDQANKNRDHLSQIFNTIRKQLNERENYLKQKIADKITSQDKQVEEKKSVIEEQIGQVGDFKRRVRQIQDVNMVTVL